MLQHAAKHELKATALFTKSTVSTGAALLRLVCPCPCAGDLALLQHDKPLAKGNSAPHLKHIPAYLRDPTFATPSFPGNAGKGMFSFCKCTVVMSSPPPPPLPAFSTPWIWDAEWLPCLPVLAMQACTFSQLQANSALLMLERNNTKPKVHSHTCVCLMLVQSCLWKQAHSSMDCSHVLLSVWTAVTCCCCRLMSVTILGLADPWQVMYGQSGAICWRFYCFCTCSCCLMCRPTVFSQKTKRQEGGPFEEEEGF